MYINPFHPHLPKRRLSGNQYFTDQGQVHDTYHEYVVDVSPISLLQKPMAHIKHCVLALFERSPDALPYIHKKVYLIHWWLLSTLTDLTTLHLGSKTVMLQISTKWRTLILSFLPSIWGSGTRSYSMAFDLARTDTLKTVRRDNWDHKFWLSWVSTVHLACLQAANGECQPMHICILRTWKAIWHPAHLGLMLMQGNHPSRSPG